MKRAREPSTHHSPRSSRNNEAAGDAIDLVTDDEQDHAANTLGLDATSLMSLSRALGVDVINAPVETLAYSFLAKHKRGEPILAEHILEVWQALP